MQRQNEKTFQATRAEAEAIIKSAKVGASFSVSIRIDLPIAGEPNHVFQDGGASYVSVSKKEALRLVRDLMSETLENRGGRLPIRCYDRDVYVRGKAGHAGTNRLATSYWIG